MDKTWLKRLELPGLQRASPVRGGDVNQAYRLDTDLKTYFLLVQPGRGEDFFAAEIAGLKAMAEAGVRTPEVFSIGVIDGDAYLLLEYLEEGDGSQRDLGRLVAKLHRVHEADNRFGFAVPYQGSSIRFDNQWANSWQEIFVERRLDTLQKELVAKGFWVDGESRQFEEVREQIVTELNHHKSESSLLHGDLWSGNYMFLADSSPVLFDPSPLYGDREFDLGISTVFGGFSPAFYEAYRTAYPLKAGWEKRLKYYRLYFLMVHLDKFGAGYASSVQREMDEILAHEGL